MQLGEGLKLEETTDFLIEWADDQRLNVIEGVAVAANVLTAGPLPSQVSIRSTTYMALGKDIPEGWLSLFEHAVDPGAVQVEQTFGSRVDNGFLTQAVSLMPCEQGEHLHASVSVTHTIRVSETDTAELLKAALYESWRDVADKMAELQDEWVHPYLERALDLDTLHGGAWN
jgi:hypothetical protein